LARLNNFGKTIFIVVSGVDYKDY